MLLIKNGTIHNAVDAVPFVADILVEQGKTCRIEKGLSMTNAEIFDAEGMDVYPE